MRKAVGDWIWSKGRVGSTGIKNREMTHDRGGRGGGSNTRGDREPGGLATKGAGWAEERGTEEWNERGT